MTRILLLRALGHHLPATHRPTPAQLEAGNYPKQKLRFQGLEISIENPRGSIRRGVDRGGKEWATAMQHHYGYIRGTLGMDGDHFDVLVGPSATAPTVYVVTTMAPPDFSATDEQKALLGFNSEEEARAAFLGMYDDPRFLGSITAMPMEGFKRQVMTTRENPRLLKARILFLKGGTGSGNFGHSGRPGQVGGSAPHQSTAGLPSSSHIASADGAHSYWREHFAGKTIALNVHVKSGIYTVTVVFDDTNTHMWTRKAITGEAPDAFDRPKQKAGPRVFDPKRAVHMDKIFGTIEHPWKVLAHGEGNVYLGTKLPDGDVYTVVLKVASPGHCHFASAYPRSKGEVANLVRSTRPTIPAGLRSARP